MHARDTDTVVAELELPSLAKVMLFVTVTTQVTVAAPDVPALLHWLIAAGVWATATGAAAGKNAVSRRMVMPTDTRARSAVRP